MIVLFKEYGNHSNRLIQNIRFEAFCMEYNIEYSNPTFEDLSEYYKKPVNVKKDLWSILLRLKVIKFLISFFPFINLISLKDNKSDSKILLNCSEKKCYVDGWHFKTHGLNKKYQDTLLNRYSLKEEYYKENKIYKELSSIDKNIYEIVGVHIRRGDYKTWKNGIYYYDDDAYKIFMNKLKNEITKNYRKKTLFVLFSNEKTSFIESDELLISNSEWYVDHYLMSMCGLLIGPPSTFTLWSSYLGKNKYLHLVDKYMDIQLENFEYYNADVN